MQIAIDSSKRVFDVSTTKEIVRIRKALNVEKNGYPKFWMIIRKGFNKSLINNSLICPMNVVVELGTRSKGQTNRGMVIPNEYFYVRYEMDEEHEKKNKLAERFIEKYITKKIDMNIYNGNFFDYENNLVLLNDLFDNMVKDIQYLHIDDTYIYLMSWILDKVMFISDEWKALRSELITYDLISKNRSLVVKILYNINKEALLKCLSKNMNL